jgi:hypothetical protein
MNKPTHLPRAVTSNALCILSALCYLLLCCASCPLLSSAAPYYLLLCRAPCSVLLLSALCSVLCIGQLKHYQKVVFRRRASQALLAGAPLQDLEASIAE